MKKNFCLVLVLVFILGSFFVANITHAVEGPGHGDIIINEFVSDPSSGSEWVELLNTTPNEINLDEWILTDLATPGTDGQHEVLNKNLNDLTIPANGIIVVNVTNLNNPGDSIGLYSTDDFSDPANAISRVTYGTGSTVLFFTADLTTLTTGQSGVFADSSWSVSDSPSKGWFNNAGEEGTAPLLEDIDDFMATADIISNIGELDNPSSTPNTEGKGGAFGALYFEKEGRGKIVFESILNLSDKNTVAVLQKLGEKMEMSDGHIEFDSATATTMNATGAKIYMYDLDSDSTPNIIVKDDAGATISGEGIIKDVNYDPETGKLSFTAAHFTQFDVDITPPTIVPTIDATGPNTVVVTFSEDLQNNEGEGHHPQASDFRVYNGENSYGINDVSYANKKVTITLTNPILAGDDPHLDVVNSRTTIVDLAGNNFFNTKSEYDHKVYKAPVITEETTTTASVTTTSIVVTWNTDHLATSRVIYDTVSHGELDAAPNYGYANSTGTSDEDPMVTSHSVNVSGLTAGTNYFFRTVSHGSPEAVSSEFSRMTSNSSGGSSGGRAAPVGQVLAASTGLFPGCETRTIGFSTTTGQSCAGNPVTDGKVLGAEKFIFTQNMKLGSKNGEVDELQKFLNTAGYECGVVDGIFGPLTNACVKAFQKANPPLKVDGIVGPLTRAVLNK